MPRNPGGRVTARPATSRSTRIPGPGNPIEDDLLRARQSTRNTTPFTAEHMAAYAAFAGITDRRTAMALHRHGVDWDAVDAYTREGIASTGYNTMQDLMQAGVTPQVLTDWNQFATQNQTHLTATEIRTYVQAGLAPQQIRPYLRHPHTKTRNAQQIVTYAARGLTPDEILDFERVNIRTIAHMHTLKQAGCTAETVTAYLTAHGHTGVPTWQVEDVVMDTYRAIARAAGNNTDLIRAALTSATSPADVTRWRNVDLHIDRIYRYMCAGITAEEWHTDPTVREVENSTLEMLAALRGHTMTTLPDTPAVADEPENTEGREPRTATGPLVAHVLTA